MPPTPGFDDGRRRRRDRSGYEIVLSQNVDWKDRLAGHTFMRS